MKTFAAALMGLVFAFVVTGIVGNLFGSVDGRAFVPMAVKMTVMLVGTAVGAWLVLRRARSWQRLVRNGSLLGAVGFSITIVSAWIYQFRVSSAPSTLGLSQDDRMNRGMDALVSAGLESLTAGFGLGVCIVGFLSSRNSHAPATVELLTPKEAPPGPNIATTKRIVAAEIILATMLAALFAWVRANSLGLGDILAAIVLVVGEGLLVILAIGGLVQGLRLLCARHHRALGITATAVSAIPILLAGFGAAKSVVELRQLDIRTAERREQYGQMKPFFRSPQVLAGARPEPGGVVLAFASGPDAHMFALDGEALAGFCNEFMVGKMLDVDMPEEERFLWSPTVGVQYEGTDLGQYCQKLMQEDERGQWPVDGAARLAARRVVAPSQPDSLEVARIARRFRALADADSSGLLNWEEGRSFSKTIEFGLEAALLAGRGLDRARIAKSTGVAPEDLDHRAQEYELLAGRIEEAGIVDLPALALPPAKNK